MKLNYEVYDEGVSAREVQKTLNENPYPENTSEHYDWYEGWTDMDEAIFRMPVKEGKMCL